MVGFMDHDQLHALFKRVDLDGNGTLDFSESAPARPALDTASPGPGPENHD